MNTQTKAYKNKHYNTPGHAHELTFTCYHRFRYFDDKEACIILLEEIKASAIEHSFHIWAYALMPHHAHILAWPTRNIYDMEQFMGFKGKMAQRYRALLNLNNPELFSKYLVVERGQQAFAFWQRGGGFDRNLWNAEAINSSISYIENNPVRANLVDSAEQWRWSSAYHAGSDEAFRPEVNRTFVPVKMN